MTSIADIANIICVIWFETRMGKVSFISIFLSSFTAGVFMAVGVDINEVVANVFNQLIDSLYTPSYGVAGTVLKIMMCLLLILLPIVVDIFLIYRSGIIGIIAAMWGFLSGFIILANAVAGAILLIIGLLIARLLKTRSNKRLICEHKSIFCF